MTRVLTYIAVAAFFLLAISHARNGDYRLAAATGALGLANLMLL